VTLLPGDETTQVRMQAETVLLEVQANTPTSSLGQAKVSASFTMLNTGSASESMAVRFPISSNDGFYAYPEIAAFTVKVNGSAVSTRRIPPTPEDTQIWAEFDAVFPPGQEVLIEVRYTLEGTGEYPFISFAYLLETGADPKKLKLPVIKVPEPKTLNLGKKIDAPGEYLISAYELFDTIREMDGANEDKLITDVDYVDVSDMNNVRFSLQNRINVNLGKLEDLHYKINTTRTIFLKSLKKTDRGVLDFSIDADPVFTPESGG
jgi:hypothetical protein